VIGRVYFLRTAMPEKSNSHPTFAFAFAFASASAAAYPHPRSP
jgi:hypothetical protein